MSNPAFPPRRRLALAALLLLAPAARSQDIRDDTGAWFAVAGTGPLDPTATGTRWRWWLDLHARFFEDTGGFGQSIVRPGLGYELQQDLTAWVGYAWIDTESVAADTVVTEHRVWEQLTFGAPFAGNRFFARTRLEQRFLETGDDTGWRFRQFFRLTRPWSEGSALSLRVWDELFFDLNETDWGADPGLRQNRFFAGLGWTFESASSLTLEVGYLNQYLHRSSAPDDMVHILGTTLIVSL